jgi:hypothetical protein
VVMQSVFFQPSHSRFESDPVKWHDIPAHSNGDGAVGNVERCDLPPNQIGGRSHRIEEIKGSFYVITVMDAFSRAILSSDIFQSQDLSCVLIVLYAAVEQFGAPQRLITSHIAMRREQILVVLRS